MDGLTKLDQVSSEPSSQFKKLIYKSMKSWTAKCFCKVNFSRCGYYSRKLLTLKSYFKPWLSTFCWTLITFDHFNWKKKKKTIKKLLKNTLLFTLFFLSFVIITFLSLSSALKLEKITVSVLKILSDRNQAIEELPKDVMFL